MGFYPVHYMRGGTSTGVVLDIGKVPEDRGLREELLRHLMGAPQAGEQSGNRQITGLGRGIPTSNKVFLVRVDRGAGRVRVESTFAQLAAQSPAIDWRVSCGNMAAALPLWVLDDESFTPLLDEDRNWWLQLDNTNTGITTTARMRFGHEQKPIEARIPGVEGAYPGIDLFVQQPAGRHTGRLLPTGLPRQTIGGVEVSCIDAAVPMVLMRASDFGKTARESPSALEKDRVFMDALRKVWVAAAMECGFRRADGDLCSVDDIARSETVPKVAILGESAESGNIAARYFTPQKAHPSMAMSGACAISVACLTPGTIAQQMVRGLSARKRRCTVTIEIPDGALQTVIYLQPSGAGSAIESVGYRRNAQLLMKGQVPIYHPSSRLERWLASRAWL